MLQPTSVDAKTISLAKTGALGLPGDGAVAAEDRAACVLHREHRGAVARDEPRERRERVAVRRVGEQQAPLVDLLVLRQQAVQRRADVRVPQRPDGRGRQRRRADPCRVPSTARK